jgi:hypothetical protein
MNNVIDINNNKYGFQVSCLTVLLSASVMDERISMEHLWYVTDREQLMYSKKDLSKCHFIRHRYHNDWPGTEPGPPC